MKKPSERPLFARNIAYLRNRQKLTRVEASKRCKISKSSWGSYEDGRAFPHHDRLSAICDTLKFHDVLALINVDLANRPVDWIKSKEDFVQTFMEIKGILDEFAKSKQLIVSSD